MAASEASQAAKRAPDISIRKFRQTEKYKHLKSALDSAKGSMEVARTSADFKERARAASRILDAKKALADAEAEAVSADPAVAAAEEAATAAEERARAERAREADEALQRQREASRPPPADQRAVTKTSAASNRRTWQCRVSRRHGQLQLPQSGGGSLGPEDHLGSFSYEDYVDAGSYEEASDMFNRKHPNEDVGQIEEKRDPRPAGPSPRPGAVPRD